MDENKLEEAISQENNNFEEVQIEQKKKEVRTDSYFDGGVLELIGWRILAILITMATLGIAGPWAQCMLYSWQFKHTVYNGKRLKFIGTGGDLFVNIFKWIFFTIITLGIYLFFVPTRKMRWIVSNLHFEDEEYVRGESLFDGKVIGLIGINILTKILTVLSFGLLFPFATCIKIKWLKKHTIINKKRLVFDGNGFGLWGKYLLWCFLTIITFGIFSLWLPILMQKWEAKHIHIKTVGEVEKKDKSIFIAIPIVIILIAIVVAIVINVMPQLFENGWEDFEKNFTLLFTNKKNNEAALVEYYGDYERALYDSEYSNDSYYEDEPVQNYVPTSINVGGYELTFGTYKGTIVQGIWDESTMTSTARYTDVYLVLREDTITLDGQTAGYTISGTQIDWNNMGFLMLEATGNNRITYYAETCPELVYQGY